MNLPRKRRFPRRAIKRITLWDPAPPTPPRPGDLIFGDWCTAATQLTPTWFKWELDHTQASLWITAQGE